MEPRITTYVGCWFGWYVELLFFFHHPVAKPKIINATIRPPLCIEISVDGGITKREWREKPSGWKGNYRTVLLLLSG